MKHTVIGNELLLNAHTCTDQPVRLELWAILPTKDWDGERIEVLNWQVQEDRRSVKITYQTRTDLCAPIYDGVFACRNDEVQLKPPGRNFKWSSFFGYWINQKTGKRIYA